MFNYTHVISYYYGNYRINNLSTTINYLNNYKLHDNSINESILVIICCIYDNENDLPAIKKEIDELLKLKNEKISINIIYRWNTGGTIKTMDTAYEYIMKNNINTEYIGVFEDDSFLKKEFILDEIKKHIDNDNIIVGSLVYENRQDINYDNNTKQFKLEYHNRRPKTQLCPWIKNKHIFINNSNEELIDDKYIKWIDGALYITTLKNLKTIKDKLINFTLCPETDKYTHIESGINYGEVGFPTRLHINGFKFMGLKHDEYYQYLDQNTIGNKHE